ncbi:hypothetical protein CcI6DRAFT_01756 [Frankia sp. CcI6]|nr:hypothetical protein CcI6DRAFT_01756 [Frankia sp. CcI6]
MPYGRDAGDDLGLDRRHADRTDPDRPGRPGRPGRPEAYPPGAGRSRPSPARFGADQRVAARRSGSLASAAGTADFPDDDDARDSRQGDRDSDTMPFLHRVGVALVVLAVALGVGVGAGAVWEKVRPSGRTANAVPAPTAASSGGPAAAAPSPSTGAAGGQAAGGQAAAGQIAVPADWTSFTDTVQKATFSHPPVWKQRRDNTGIFYGEPGTVSEYGPQMIGVARVAVQDPVAALTQVQSAEFNTVPGLTRDHSGPATDTSDQPTQELAGSYDREGQRVSYLMRTVSVAGAVYVLIARVSTNVLASLNTLMGALRSSFAPA